MWHDTLTSKRAGMTCAFTRAALHSLGFTWHLTSPPCTADSWDDGLSQVERKRTLSGIDFDLGIALSHLLRLVRQLYTICPA